VASISPGAARVPEGEGNVDEDQRSELAPVEPCEDDNDAVEGDFGADVDFGSGRLTFPVAFDLLGRNPKHADAMESIRLAVIRWARRDGLVEEADDIAGEVMLKLALPGELAKARGRATFKGFVYGYYRNEKKAVVRERRDNQMFRDLEVLERTHRDEPQSNNDDGGPVDLGGNPVAGIDLGDLDFDDVEGLSPKVTVAVQALVSCSPRAFQVIRLRCFGASYDEVADELGITEANARKIHSRGIRFLAKYLGERPK
jgi:RNA polymerase sigma factor (sigma-70 family)